MTTTFYRFFLEAESLLYPYHSPPVSLFDIKAPHPTTQSINVPTSSATVAWPKLEGFWKVVLFPSRSW